LSGYGITDQAGLQTETVTYVANVRAAGGDLDWTTITWVDWLVVSGKRDGWWTLYDEIYIFCGNNLAASLVKLKYGTGTGSSLTNNNFVAADFTQAGGFGVTTGNSTKFLNTGYIPSNFSASCANISVIATGTNDNIAASASSGNAISTLKTGNSSGSEIVYFQSTAGTGCYTVDAYEQNVSNSSAKVHGFAATSNLHHGCINGVRTNYWAQASSTALTAEVGLFKGCFSGSNNRYGNGVLGTVMLGRYATPTQLKAATLAVWQFERGIGRTAFQTRPLLVGDGDSITSGQGSTNWYDSFYHQVVRRTGSQVFNTGMPACEGINDTGPVGGVTKNGDILSVASSGTATVMYGTNDMTNSRTSSAYQTAMTTIVSGYVGKRWNVIVCSAPYSSAFAQSTRRAYAVAAATVAKTYGVPFVDTDRAISDLTTEGTLGSYMADSKHPNTAGHTLIANRILSAMSGSMIRRLTLTFSATLTNTTSSQTVEVLNAVAGQTVTVTLDTPTDGITYRGVVTANDTVTVYAINSTLGTVTPASSLTTIEVR
jgi:lysophospholipase L1-like esterase